MSVPRGGKGKVGYSTQDGAEYASSAEMSMSWSTFLYGEDVWVYVSTMDPVDTISSVDDVTIRPTTLGFTKQMVNSTTIGILVPYQAQGYRFSVEFNTQLITTYNTLSGSSSGTPSTTPGSNGVPIHIEPRNSLLIFAEAIPTGNLANALVPSSGDIYYPPTGSLTGLENINHQIIYFQPGVYYMGSNYAPTLSTTVQWIYLAPGAFVKGSFELQGGASWLRITGFGVLSGEQYTYMPDRNNGLNHAQTDTCDGTCVRMLQFFVSSGTSPDLDLHGITLMEPPFNSFVVYAYSDSDLNQFSMSVASYHQVGAWYWQTDGLEVYANSIVENSFFHSNDDVLKLYHSDTSLSNIVIWKSENGPVFQVGWAPRNIINITVDDVDIIHNRIWWEDLKVNTCLINQAPSATDTSSITTADTTQTIQDLTFNNVRSEGMNMCFIRIWALSNLYNVNVNNMWIESWNGMPDSSQQSVFHALYNSFGSQVIIGNEVTDGQGLGLSNYQASATIVTKAANNWQDTSVGRLNFDGNLWNNWNAF
ncbi:family 49 glycosyl hydrolase [Lipomyces doorenjongii]|uniref:family 49 glycosyl hydrolase n=1 Tax=Lipomyces doorenjongii TaxID=383834 RepID=UPI0034CF2C5B